MIINANGVYGVHDTSSIVFSNNNGTPHRGGTCSGDSGGPVFLGDFESNLIVGVTSFGLNALCRGTDFAYRIDHPDVLAWIEENAVGELNYAE